MAVNPLAYVVNAKETSANLVWVARFIKVIVVNSKDLYQTLVHKAI